jgi:hypothetical protein
MKDVQETLDRLVPESVQISDWEAVLREARPRRRSLVLQLAAATVLAGVAALFVAAPWNGGERVGILDRALAAAGDGPVLHVVFRGGWGGTLVDLKTGERKPIYGEREVWFDPSRDLVHQISRFGGAVEGEELYERNKRDRELTALWRDYRPALEAGTARVIGEDVVGGVPVYWIIVRALMLPDVADHRNHELAQQVAVSRETFKPVAMRYTRDRHALANGTEHILRFETISLEDADFTSPPERSLNGVAMTGGREPIDIARASEVLGRRPYWLGPEYAGLPLGQAQKVFSATGRRVETLVTGPRAGEIRRCLESRLRLRRARARQPGTPSTRVNCPPHMGSVEIRNGKVYERRGPVHFGPEQTGLALFYGKIGDEPSTFKKEDSSPLYSEPNVVLTEKTKRGLRLLGSWAPAFDPPEGSVLLMPGSSGYLVRDGVHISIRATSDELALGAARALRPMD